MPIIRYFVFVGGLLFTLLFAADRYCRPQPSAKARPIPIGEPSGSGRREVFRRRSSSTRVRAPTPRRSCRPSRCPMNRGSRCGRRRPPSRSGSFRESKKETQSGWSPPACQATEDVEKSARTSAGFGTARPVLRRLVSGRRAPLRKGRAFGARPWLRLDGLVSPVVVAMPAVPHDRIGSAEIGVGGAHDAAITVAVGYGRRVVGRGVAAAPAIGVVVAIVVGVRTTQ
ncbi:hypothetical protein ABIE91_006515 [Bradyrhizobium elkanii]